MTENQTRTTTRKRIDEWLASCARHEQARRDDQDPEPGETLGLIHAARDLMLSIRRMQYRLLDAENQVADDALVYHTNYLVDAFVDRGIKDPDREQVLDFLYDIETSGDEEGLIFFAGKARGLQEARQIYDIST